MVDEVSLQPSVAILEGVNVNEAEGERSCREDRIEVVCGSPVESNQSLYQGRQVFMPGTDMFRQRRTGFTVMLADETALMTQAQTHIARVANNDALQAKQFVEVDRPAPRLADGPAPALNAILRRMLAFDGKARFGILQQQECSSTREQVAGHVRHCGARPFGQIARGEGAERLCAEDHRAERRRARQVVFDAMT